MGSNLGKAKFFLFFPLNEKKWDLACPNFDECTARVKLELTDFSISQVNSGDDCISLAQDWQSGSSESVKFIEKSYFGDSEICGNAKHGPVSTG